MALSAEQIEAFAIRAALGNNGGEWATHYNEAQKEHWRGFVRDLAGDTIPAGFVVAPKDPTDEMMRAGATLRYSEDVKGLVLTADVYRAMIEARPQ